MKNRVLGAVPKALLLALAVVALASRSAEAADAREVITAKTEIAAGPTDTVDRLIGLGDTGLRVKLVGGTAYIAVQSGTLNLTFSDGTAFTTVPAGTVLKIEGFLANGSSVTVNLVGGKAALALGPVDEMKLSSNAKGGTLELKVPGEEEPVSLAPAASATVTGPAVAVRAGETMPALKEGQVARFAGITDTVAYCAKSGTVVTHVDASALEAPAPAATPATPTPTGADEEVTADNTSNLVTADGATFEITSTSKAHGSLTVQNGNLQLLLSTITVTGAGAKIGAATGLVTLMAPEAEEPETMSATSMYTTTGTDRLPAEAATYINLYKHEENHPEAVMGDLDSWVGTQAEAAPAAAPTPAPAPAPAH
ncbi:MAG TPA: hypothetical protein VL860_09695 [Planctomycetota bacterium]|nr:hypothetical protein [Planctomycetota bacterium]